MDYGPDTYVIDYGTRPQDETGIFHEYGLLQYGFFSHRLHLSSGGILVPV